MPRYVFHIHDDQSNQADESADLPDLRAAKLFAIRHAGRVLANDPERAITGQWAVSVTLEGDGTVYEVTVLGLTIPQSGLH